jgi:hypothetical protein
MRGKRNCDGERDSCGVSGCDEKLLRVEGRC